MGRRKGAAAKRRLNADLAPLRAAQARIEERLAVLESLATDPGERLRKEIEDLAHAASTPSRQ